METVDAVEAQTQFAALLERVERGETLTITRHGKPVAKLVRVEQRDPVEIEAAIKRIKELASGQTLGGLDWRELRDEGRK
jgi:prevent-host-death family protein